MTVSAKPLFRAINGQGKTVKEPLPLPPDAGVQVRGRNDRAYRLRVSVPATDYNMMVPVQEYELWGPSEPRRGYYPD